MLSIVLPTGSLEKPTLEVMAGADLPVTPLGRRSYEGWIDDPRVSRVRFLRPQEIPVYVAAGLFDLGITGLDWVIERGCEEDVVEIADLPYSRATDRPVRIVLAVAEDSPVQKPEDIPPGSRITTEYVNLTRRYFERLGIDVEVEFSFGTTEAKVPEIADACVELTERGETLRANNLRIVAEVARSSTKLIANPAAYKDKQKKQAIDEIATLITGTLEARGRVLLKMNVAADRLQDVLAALPAMKAPTVAPLQSNANGNYYAVETVANKSEINILLPKLKAAGAEDILELQIGKIVR